MRICFVGNFRSPFSSENYHAQALESLGHTVIRLQEAEASGDVILEWSKTCQMLVFIHTHGWETPGMPVSDVFHVLSVMRIPTVTYHLDLWMGLRRQEDLENDPFYRTIGHFFSVDRLMAEWFNENTDVKGHYLLAAVPKSEAVMAHADPSQPMLDVAFVGSYGYHPEWPWRPMLIDYLKDMYGDRFRHIGGGSEHGSVRGLALNQLLANTKVVVGDSLCPGFDYPDYSSDRVFEITGRGGFVIYPHIKGIENWFKIGTELVTYEYGDLPEVGRLVDYYLEHDFEREMIRKAGYDRTARDHTYDLRWSQIIREVME